MELLSRIGIQEKEQGVKNNEFHAEQGMSECVYVNDPLLMKNAKLMHNMT